MNIVFKKMMVATAILQLASCAPKSPTPEDIAIMQSAPKPSSQKAAENAVKSYFVDKLFDDETARWQFSLPPVRGSIHSLIKNEAGWFMCGKVNAKNRMGGYTGYTTFFAYFSPNEPDKVVDGAIVNSYGGVDAAENYSVVWCQNLYGQKYN